MVSPIRRANTTNSLNANSSIEVLAPFLRDCDRFVHRDVDATVRRCHHRRQHPDRFQRHHDCCLLLALTLLFPSRIEQILRTHFDQSIEQPFNRAIGYSTDAHKPEKFHHIETYAWSSRQRSTGTHLPALWWSPARSVVGWRVGGR